MPAGEASGSEPKMSANPSIDEPGGDTAPVADASFSPWLAEATILVVDDEPGMRNFLVRMLESRCRRVEAAADTVAAARLLDAAPFDLLILDT